MSAGPAADPNMAYAYQFPPSGPPMMPQYGGGSSHHGHGGRGGQSHGGSAPFRPGDWRCGQPDCLYHNFAKNVTCLRCGSSRANALASGHGHFMNMNDGTHQFGGFHGPPGAGGPPGPDPSALGVPAGFSSPAPGFPGPGGFGAPSPYMPSGMGGPAPYGSMAGGFAPNGMPGTGFDSRAAEAAFSNAGNTGPGAPPGGPPAPGFPNGGASNFDGSQGADPFSFLGTGLGNLNLDENRRNGGGPSGKSPA